MLDCNHCKLGRGERAGWHCGFVPVSEHFSAGFPSFEGAPKLTVDDNDPRMQTVCPGYSTSLPQIYEAGQALQWAKRGCLRDLFEDDEPLTDQLRFAIDILDAEIGAAERHMLSKHKNSDG